MNNINLLNTLQIKIPSFIKEIPSKLIENKITLLASIIFSGLAVILGIYFYRNDKRKEEPKIEILNENNKFIQLEDPVVEEQLQVGEMPPEVKEKSLNDHEKKMNEVVDTKLKEVEIDIKTQIPLVQIPPVIDKSRATPVYGTVPMPLFGFKNQIFSGDNRTMANPRKSTSATECTIQYDDSMTISHQNFNNQNLTFRSEINIRI